VERGKKNQWWRPRKGEGRAVPLWPVRTKEEKGEGRGGDVASCALVPIEGKERNGRGAGREKKEGATLPPLFLKRRPASVEGGGKKGGFKEKEKKGGKVAFLNLR